MTLDEKIKIIVNKSDKMKDSELYDFIMKNFTSKELEKLLEELSRLNRKDIKERLYYLILDKYIY